ncbi:hypothetical protein KIH41_02260 [Litoribacter ruber]|uniref:OmpA family protein n=1 Tax=Litoribacter ruber TaxID=702568 RepID=A0AAP2CJN6_9BACT|nr:MULTISPECIES: DUF6520 family protein [Litoribacter]MBS9525988.1 hypothetical protein [Litoribacter alkaliphilus]MBT0810103.1 hypothetical protein [Litoribacter ruber]
MKKIVKSLPALGLALAATMAFAFNMPSKTNQVKFADHPTLGPINVTNWTLGEDYECDSGDQCTYDENGMTVEQGAFIPLRE